MGEEFRVPTGCYHLRLTALGPSLEPRVTGPSPVFFIRPWRGIEALCALVCPKDDQGYNWLPLEVRDRHCFW